MVSLELGGTCSVSNRYVVMQLERMCPLFSEAAPAFECQSLSFSPGDDSPAVNTCRLQKRFGVLSSCEWLLLAA
jgi:hypothetical protein